MWLLYGTLYHLNIFKFRTIPLPFVFYTAEENISEFKDITIQTIQNETQTKYWNTIKAMVSGKTLCGQTNI